MGKKSSNGNYHMKNRASYLITSYRTLLYLTDTPEDSLPPLILGEEYCTPRSHISNEFKYKLTLIKSEKRIIPVGFQAQHNIIHSDS